MRAVIDQPQSNSEWEGLCPLLDEAMAQLREKDRDALVLRFFQNRSLQEVGAALGIEEGAAQKRVSRGLEKLRTFFGRRGVTLSAAVIAGDQATPADVPPGVQFASGSIGEFVSHLREQPGKDIWLMGGGELIASFLDERAIDEFVISVVPVFIGDGIPLIARRHRHVPLQLLSTERFEDGLVQLRYRVQNDS